MKEHKCIYCGASADLSESDIIPDALTNARITNKNVCRVAHNNRFSDLFESKVIEALSFITNELDIKSSKGKRYAAYDATVTIDGESYKISLQSDKAIFDGRVLKSRDKSHMILVLPKVAAFQLCFGLLLGQLQRIQLFLGGADGILQQLLLLGQQFRIGGVQLQQLGNILQTGLGRFDGRVDAFQRLIETCGIAADLNGNALDSACQIASPPKNGHKNSPDCSEHEKSTGCQPMLLNQCLSLQTGISCFVMIHF